MKKLTSTQIREHLGHAYSLEGRRPLRFGGPHGISIDVIELEDGRVGNILVRVPTERALSSASPESRYVVDQVARLLEAHEFSSPTMRDDVLQDMLTAIEGKVTTGGSRFVGVDVKELTSLALIQFKITYEPERN